MASFVRLATTRRLFSTWGPDYKQNVMFLCNHNSCRSQMAEGWLRALRGDANNFGVASSGIVGGTEVRPEAIQVMKEVDVDISFHTSDAVASFDPDSFDTVISCCGCTPLLDAMEAEATSGGSWKSRPGGYYDWDLDDPPAIDGGDLESYRRVRDECRAMVEELIEREASS